MGIQLHTGYKVLPIVLYPQLIKYVVNGGNLVGTGYGQWLMSTVKLVIYYSFRHIWVYYLSYYVKLIAK